MSGRFSRRTAVADIFSTVRKVVLPVPLLEQAGRRLLGSGESGCKARQVVDLCMEQVDSFNSLAVCVSDMAAYQQFLSTALNTNTAAITLFFKPAYWERMLRVQNEHNIGCGDIARLILASLLFNSGSIALPLERLSRLFVSGRSDYAYNTVLARPVATLLLETEKTALPINREAVIRAAHCYFSVVPDELPAAIHETLHRVDNEATGWIRQTVAGSMEMKAYFHGLKQATGKSLATVIAHTAYSFLQKLREAQADAER
jgi:hypothetical protein